MDAHFNVLDAAVSLTGPAEILKPIVTAYGRFVVPREECRSPARIVLETGEGGGIRIDDRTFPFAADLDPVFQLYQQFLLTVLDQVGSCAVLHGAALVDRRGDAFLVAAPAGHGKTSLTLELVSRGYTMLSDDYAPLDLETACVHPYPRTVAVLPDGDAPIPEAFRSASRDPQAVRLFEKVLVDVGHLLGEERLARQPAPLRRVLLLSGYGDDAPGAASTWLQVATESKRADRLEAGMRGIDGVEILERSEVSHLRVWRLRLHHDRYPTSELMRLIDGEEARYCEKYWETQPDFNATPSSRPLGRRETAELLGRELLNRRKGGRFMARYTGGVAEVFFDLAGALRDCGCHRISVGRFSETADLIENVLLETT